MPAPRAPRQPPRRRAVVRERMERRGLRERPRPARPRMRWLVLLGALVVVLGAVEVWDRERADDRQELVERVGQELADLPGAVELRPVEPAPEGGGAYAGRIRDASGAQLRFGVVVGADLADTPLPRILPALTRAADGDGWLLVSDASADPQLAARRSRLQAEVVAALRQVLPDRAGAP